MSFKYPVIHIELQGGVVEGVNVNFDLPPGTVVIFTETPGNEELIEREPVRVIPNDDNSDFIYDVKKEVAKTDCGNVHEAARMWYLQKQSQEVELVKPSVTITAPDTTVHPAKDQKVGFSAVYTQELHDQLTKEKAEALYAADYLKGAGSTPFKAWPVSGGGCVPIAEAMIGRKWDDDVLSYLHAFRPSSIRVVNGGMHMDAQRWRVTVHVDENYVIKRIEQEVAFGHLDFGTGMKIGESMERVGAVIVNPASVARVKFV